MPPVANKLGLLPPSLLDVANGRGAACPVKTLIEDSAPRIDFGHDFSDRNTLNASVAPASKRVTVYDIAKKVGVSHTTVACALGNCKEVSPKRREEILRVAAVMGSAAIFVY